LRSELTYLLTYLLLLKLSLATPLHTGCDADNS